MIQQQLGFGIRRRTQPGHGQCEQNWKEAVEHSTIHRGEMHESTFYLKEKSANQQGDLIPMTALNRLARDRLID